MEDLRLIVGRRIGLVVLTVHDDLRYRQDDLRRRQQRPRPRRRLSRALGQARAAARRQRALPYTGATQRLHAGDALQPAPDHPRPSLDLRTLSPDDLWRAVLQR